MADPIFEEPRLAELYDDLDADRSDLDVYVALVDELGGRRVLDIGCGTGTFAHLLARRGQEVTAVDPAPASLDVARRKPGADRIRWLEGTASSLPPLQVDVVTMTANVAQVYLKDEDWTSTLRATRAALRPGGFLVFEVRDPAQRAWINWTAAASRRRIDGLAVGAVETWVEVTDVTPPLVSFRHTFRFEADGTVLRSDSTLRFRERAEIVASLEFAGFLVHDVRGAPDRPRLEFVFIAQRPVEARPVNDESDGGSVRDV